MAPLIGGAQIITHSVAYWAEKMGVSVNVDKTNWVTVGIVGSYETELDS